MVAINHVYQTIAGYTEEELRALGFLDVTHQDYREANWALITVFWSRNIRWHSWNKTSRNQLPLMTASH